MCLEYVLIAKDKNGIHWLSDLPQQALGRTTASAVCDIPTNIEHITNTRPIVLKNIKNKIVDILDGGFMNICTHYELQHYIMIDEKGNIYSVQSDQDIHKLITIELPYIHAEYLDKINEYELIIAGGHSIYFFDYDSIKKKVIINLHTFTNTIQNICIGQHFNYHTLFVSLNNGDNYIGECNSKGFIDIKKMNIKTVINHAISYSPYYLLVDNIGHLYVAKEDKKDKYKKIQCKGSINYYILKVFERKITDEFRLHFVIKLFNKNSSEFCIYSYSELSNKMVKNVESVMKDYECRCILKCLSDDFSVPTMCEFCKLVHNNGKKLVPCKSYCQKDFCLEHQHSNNVYIDGYDSCNTHHLSPSPYIVDYIDFRNMLKYDIIVHNSKYLLSDGRVVGLDSYKYQVHGRININQGQTLLELCIEHINEQPHIYADRFHIIPFDIRKLIKLKISYWL